MVYKKPNMTCRYSKCDKQYYACADSRKYGHYKSCGCCIEHFWMYQNEVAYFRGEEMPFSELVPMMVEDGALPESVLQKENTPDSETNEQV